jgi:hypothetical protein
MHILALDTINIHETKECAHKSPQRNSCPFCLQPVNTVINKGTIAEHICGAEIEGCFNHYMHPLQMVEN